MSADRFVVVKRARYAYRVVNTRPARLEDARDQARRLGDMAAACERHEDSYRVYELVEVPDA